MTPLPTRRPPTSPLPPCKTGVSSRLLAAWMLALATFPALPATPLPVSDLTRGTPVDFETEILPILQRNCLACHNQTRAKADLLLETPATIRQGGASGPAVAPGKPDDSLLFQSAAHRIDDLVMPPLGNKSNAENLTPDELGLLRLWIQQGAEGDVQAARTLAWQPIPDSWNSSYAVALDRDTHLVACARANRVQLYDARTGRSAGRLQDPELQGATQRDIVTALAFSPVEDVLATAGFREVRLWRRSPVLRTTMLQAPPGIPWNVASLNPDRTLVALVTASGDLHLHRTDTGVEAASWSGITSTPALIRFSPDATRLAVVGASGTLRVLPVAGGPSLHDQPVGGDTVALAWFDGGRALATVLRDATTLQTWRIPERSDSSQLIPGPTLATHSAAITALTTDGTGALVSASEDGTVLRWPEDPTSAPAAIRAESAVTGLVAASQPNRLIATLAGGGSALLEFGEKPTLLRRFQGDPRLAAAVTRAEQDQGQARLELAFAEKSIQDAEADTKKTGETLAKARESRETQAKALAEKQQTLSQHQQTEAKATQERDDLAAELQRATDAAAAAEKTAADSRLAAQAAADRVLATRLAAENADRLRSDLERIVQTLAGRAEEPSLVKARDAAQAAAAAAATKSQLSDEARALAEKGLEALADHAFAAGRKRAVADRANAELPPRKKQAEETLTAAKKAIADLKPQLEKARIALEGGEKDVQLAEQSAGRAVESLRAGTLAAESARRRIAEGEERLKHQQSLADTAAAQTHPFSLPTPSGTDLLTVASDGTTLVWDLASGTASHAFQTDAGPLLAIAAVDETTALLLRSDSIQRVAFAPRWERFRTLGDGAPSSAATPASLVDRVNALAFTPDGSLLATGGGEPSRSGELKLWRTADGTLAKDLGSIHSDCVLALAFSPRGERLASGGADRYARISDVHTGQLMRSLEAHTHHVMSVAWLAHGGVLASAGAEGTVKIWNAHTGDRLKNVDGFGKEVTGVRSVGNTNQFIAVAGSGQGRVLRENGEKVRDLPSAPSFFQALAVSRDGRWAAVAADDGILRLWDVENAMERFALPPN